MEDTRWLAPPILLVLVAAMFIWLRLMLRMACAGQLPH